MVANCPDYLVPEIRKILELSVSERIMHIEKDNWIGYPRAKEALDKLQSLYLHPQCQRMPNLLIIGPTNNGKSMIIEKFCREYPPIKKKPELTLDWGFKDYKEELFKMPVLCIQMLPTPNLKRFYYSIFEQLRLAGAVDLLHAAPFEAEVVEALRRFKVKMLVVDEIHNILAGQNSKQHELLNVLRYLGNTLRIPIVCVGTKDAYLAIRSDPQLENRFEPFLLPTWKASQEYESLLLSIVSTLPLKKHSHLNHPTISKGILVKSEGILGEIFTLIRRAAIIAVNSGSETIDEAILKMVDYHSPTERIRLFERHISKVNVSQ